MCAGTGRSCWGTAHFARTGDLLTKVWHLPRHSRGDTANTIPA